MHRLTQNVIKYDMSEPPLAPHLRAYALNFAARLAPLLRALALLAGYRFARNPILAPFPPPLQHHLMSAARRIGILMAKLAQGQTTRPAPPREPSPRTSRPAPPKPRMPTGLGWLIRALPSEAITFSSQLHALLAEPEIAEILESCRRARRILAPVARALSSAQPNRPPRRSLLPLRLFAPGASPPSAIPSFLLYPTPIPPPIARKIPA